jgi:hypothetical protein
MLKPIPPDLIRDLLAIARLLYAAEQANGGHPVRLQEIADVGRSLKAAMAIASEAEPGSLGMANAWRKTEDATALLVRLIADERALPLVEAAEARMLKVKRALTSAEPSDREAKRLSRERRG